MLTRRDLLCCGGAAALFASWMKGSSALAQASADRPSGLKTDHTSPAAQDHAMHSVDDDPQSFSHRFATTNGICLHYVDEGQGPLVLLLHGFPYLWYAWRHQIRALAVLNAALARQPYDLDVLNALVVMNREAGNFQAALVDARKPADAPPDDPGVRRLVADLERRN